MFKTVLFALIVSSIFVAGCSTLSKGECIEADWYEIGLRDGMNGYKRARLDSHREACSEHGITPDRKAYYLGREEGLIRYCTPQKALIEGKQNHTYRNVCPPEIENQFLAAFELGKNIYLVETDIRQTELAIDHKERELDKSKDNDKRRRELREEIYQLDRNLRSLRMERDHLYELEKNYL